MMSVSFGSPTGGLAGTKTAHNLGHNFSMIKLSLCAISLETDILSYLFCSHSKVFLFTPLGTGENCQFLVNTVYFMFPIS